MLITLNIIQYLLISLFVSITILRKRNTNYEIIQKHDTIYTIMGNHTSMSRFVKYVVEKANIKRGNILNHYDIDLPDHFCSYFQKMAYIYFFKSANLCVYFFQYMNDPIHHVYFEGVNELGDLQYLSFPNGWFNEYTLKSIRRNLAEKGYLFKVIEGRVLRIKNHIHTIFNAFSYMNHHEYASPHKQILIEGYSMGGVLSQIFSYILLQQMYIQTHDLKIELYIIESWWGGNRQFYEYLSKHIKITNVMCMGSILYYYNQIFQRYFRIHRFIQFDGKPLFYKYIRLPFPFGITEYFGDHHYISRTLQFIRNQRK